MRKLRRILCGFSILFFGMTFTAYAVTSDNLPTAERQDSIGFGEYVSRAMIGGAEMFDKATEPRGIPVGFGEEKLWRLKPEFEFKTAYDSNVDRENKNTVDDVSFSYIPALTLSRYGTRLTIESQYALEMKHFLETQGGMSYNSFVSNKVLYDDGKLVTNLYHDFKYADARFSTEDNERKSTTTNRIQAEVAYNIGPKLAPSLIYENYVYNQKESDVAETRESSVVSDTESSLESRDYVYNSFGGRLYYHWHSEFDFYIEGTGYLYDYETGSKDAAGFTTSFGTRGRIGKKITVSSKVGFEYRNYDSSDIKDPATLVLEGVAKYRVTPVLDLMLALSREQVPSTSIGEAYYEASRVELGVDYRITPLLSAQGNIFAQLNDYPGSSTRDAETETRDDFTLRAKAELIYTPIEHVEIGVSYRFRTRNSSFEDLDYVTHYVETSIAYKF